MHNYLTNTATNLSIWVCIPLSRLWREPSSAIVLWHTCGVRVCLASTYKTSCSVMASEEITASDTLDSNNVLQSVIISLMLHQLQPGAATFHKRKTTFVSPFHDHVWIYEALFPALKPLKPARREHEPMPVDKKRMLSSSKCPPVHLCFYGPGFYIS